MYEEIIFMDQLLQFRSVASQVQDSRITWDNQSSWFPAAQREYYSQYGKIYEQSLQQYGEKIFGIYADRIRLIRDYRPDTRASMDMDKDNDISMDHLKGYKIPRTTNGEYGSVRPSDVFNCF
ncbi:hypothetical protein KR018_001628 [Drosophila ironensis]|nr:hypothetical protein KR018_001628 [Drosophila ironensis]